VKIIQPQAFLLIDVRRPKIGFPVAGLPVEDMPFNEAVIISAGLSFVMLIFNLIRLRKAK
jgi:hypothetical protein